MTDLQVGQKEWVELQAQAYDIQYKWNKISIVRPANVYGPYDNFDPENAMVIPSLIHRAISGERLLMYGETEAPSVILYIQKMLLKE